MGAALSREVAHWLKLSGGFKDVVWEPQASSDPTAEELARLREKGYDLDRDSESIARGLDRERVARAVPHTGDGGAEVGVPIFAQIEDLGDEAGSRFDDILDRIVELIW